MPSASYADQGHRRRSHQTYRGEGHVLGALDENPYKLDVAKGEGAARQGRPARTVSRSPWTCAASQPDDGHRDCDPADRSAKAGVKVEIIPGDGKQTLTKYRARNHDHLHRQLGPGLLGSKFQRR
jgi:peptide/nickel transport system substrate-binding protein